MAYSRRAFATSAPLLAVGMLLLSGCEQTEGLTKVEANVEFEPEVLDFGAVTVGTAKAQKVLLRSVGSSPFQADSVSITPGFSLRGLRAPFEESRLPPGDTMMFDVVFLPPAAGPVEGQLVLTMGDASFTLPLRAQGTVQELSQLAADPTALDFGAVTIGVTDQRLIELRNQGNIDAVVSQVQLASDMSGARQGAIFKLDAPDPLTVPAGGRLTVSVSFTPVSGATFSDSLVFIADTQPDPVVVSVRGSGTAALGDLTCAPSLSFGTVERGSAARQALTCTANGGNVRVTGINFADPVRFRLPNGPGTPASLTSGGTYEVAVDFNAQGSLGPVSSTMTVGYEGASGNGSVEVRLQATVGEPPPSATAISIALTWDTRNTDLDLHLTAPGGLPTTSPSEMAAADELDCNYADIGGIDDWGARGDQTDDCFLDVDDIDGLGPERINMTSAAPGTYRVYIHSYRDRGSSGATVDVTLGGQPAGRFSRGGMRCNDLWYVGDIVWDGSTGTFNAVDTVARDDGGNC